jgi:hypothetical protein
MSLLDLLVDERERDSEGEDDGAMEESYPLEA